MVFSGLYLIDGDQFTDLREALEKLRLNDSSFTFEPETSGCSWDWFLVRLPRPAPHGNRARAPRASSGCRDFTAPSAEYHITKGDGSVLEVSNPRNAVGR